MIYYLYQITNTVNGKIYIGVHKTTDIDDGYMGSGKILQSAVKKYGIENFTKTILETFSNSAEMYAREKEIVTEDFVRRSDVYNIKIGGLGGFDYIVAARKNCNHVFSPEQRSKGGKTSGQLSAARWKANPGLNPTLFSKEFNKRSSELARAPAAIEKKKKTFAKIGHQQKEKNSQFGTCWISHALFGNKKCPKALLPEYIEQGWVKGRNKYKH